MQAIVENGKVIANGVAYLVPEVKNGTKVKLIFNAYSPKFCLVNYKDRKGVMQSHKAIAELILPDNHMQDTAGRVASSGCYDTSTAAEKRMARMTLNHGVETANLMQEFKISEYCRINQETYLGIVKHLKLGMLLNNSAKALGVTRHTVKKYRGVYHRANAGGYELVLVPNTIKGKKSLSVCTLRKFEVLNAE